LKHLTEAIRRIPASNFHRARVAQTVDEEVERSIRDTHDIPATHDAEEERSDRDVFSRSPVTVNTAIEKIKRIVGRP
jgi:hypothetical protein